MANLLTKGQQMLARRLQRAAAPQTEVDGELVDSPLSYQPVSGGEPIDLTSKAWVGRTVFVHRNPAGRGPSVVFGDRDYLIPIAELPAEPVKGDRLTERLNGYDVTFELVVTAGEPAWRYADPGHTIYRVHVKQVSKAEA